MPTSFIHRFATDSVPFMKRNPLARYERDPRGRVIIDVSASRAEDLYSDFDKNAPYIRRDLDQNLVDYLIECAQEIGGEPFLIRFVLDQAPGEAQLSRVQGSVQSFFAYLSDSSRRDFQKMIRTSLVLMGMGLALFAVSVWVNGLLGAPHGVAENVLAEGLTVAAWVALWEALAKFVIEAPSQIRSISLFRRIAASELLFVTPPSANPDLL